jgi:hypothetical protein
MTKSTHWDPLHCKSAHGKEIGDEKNTKNSCTNSVKHRFKKKYGGKGGCIVIRRFKKNSNRDRTVIPERKKQYKQGLHCNLLRKTIQEI